MCIYFIATEILACWQNFITKKKKNSNTKTCTYTGYNANNIINKKKKLWLVEKRYER